MNDGVFARVESVGLVAAAPVLRTTRYCREDVRRIYVPGPSMTAISTIEKVLATGVLSPNLSFVPGRGAMDEELRILAGQLSRPLSLQHTALLRRWNGINLD